MTRRTPKHRMESVAHRLFPLSMAPKATDIARKELVEAHEATSIVKGRQNSRLRPQLLPHSRSGLQTIQAATSAVAAKGHNARLARNQMYSL